MPTHDLKPRLLHLAIAGALLLVVLAPAGAATAAAPPGMSSCDDDIELVPGESVYVGVGGISETELRDELSERLAVRFESVDNLTGTPDELARRVVDAAMLDLRNQGAIPANEVPPYALSDEYLGAAIEWAAETYGIPSNGIPDLDGAVEGASLAAAIPSNGIPSNVLEDGLVDQIVLHTGAERSVIERIIGKLFETEAIPSNGIPSNLHDLILEELDEAAIPSNAIPSNVVVLATIAAIPSNALPSNLAGLIDRVTATVDCAIPSNGIPSNAIPANAIPSNAIPSNMTEVVASEILGPLLLGGLPPIDMTKRSLGDHIEASLRLAIPSNAIPSNLRAIIDTALDRAIPSNAIPSNAIPSNLAGLLRSGLANAIPSNAIPSNLTSLISGAAFRAIPSNAIPANAAPPFAIPQAGAIAGMFAELAATSLGHYPDLAAANGLTPASLAADLQPAFAASLAPGGAFLDASPVGLPADGPALPSVTILAMPSEPLGAMAPSATSTCAQVTTTRNSYGIDCSPQTIDPLARVHAAANCKGPACSFGLQNPVILSSENLSAMLPSQQAALGRQSEPDPLCGLIDQIRPSRTCSTSSLPSPWKVLAGDTTGLRDWWEDGWTVSRHNCGYTLSHPAYGSCRVSIGVTDVDRFIEEVSDDVWRGDTSAFERLNALECSGWLVSINDVGYSLCHREHGCRGGIFAIREGTLYGPPILKQEPPFGWLKKALDKARSAADRLLDLFRSDDDASIPQACTLCGQRGIEIVSVPIESPITTQPPTTQPPTTQPPTTQPTTTTSTTSTTTPPPGTITVGSYIGMSCSAARAAITSQGLTAGSCQFSWYATVDSGLVGTIDSQEPESGTEVSAGALVELWQWEAPANQSECSSTIPPGYWRDGGCYSTP